MIDASQYGAAALWVSRYFGGMGFASEQASFRTPAMSTPPRFGAAAMEIYVNGPLEQQALFSHLIKDAARRASSMLALPHEAARLRSLADDGMTAIERFEHSPLVEDQLVATALRLSPSAARPRAIAGALRTHFTTPPGWLAVEAQRRAVWNDMVGRGLPLELVAPTAAGIEERLNSSVAEMSARLRAYADLYSDLWCDPRIAAPAPARREMLALVSVLQARCASLEGMEDAP